jgi:alkylated DNA repair dioxygenase AlkB
MFKHVSGYAFHDLSLNLVHSLVKWEQPYIRMYGKDVAIPRLTCWMGEATYTYSGHKNIPGAMPEAISALRDKLQAKTGAQFNSCLANYYRDGSDSVSWHSDDEKELGLEPVIASLSFGASRDFKVKHKETGIPKTFHLQNGDLLVMSGKSQADYVHCVPKTKREVGPRINLTFRLIK